MNRYYLIAVLVLCMSPSALADDGKVAEESDDSKTLKGASPPRAAATAEGEKHKESTPQPVSEPDKPKDVGTPDVQKAPKGLQTRHSEGNVREEGGGEGMPHGALWSDGVYGSSGWWTSLRAGLGVSFVQVNEGIATRGSQMGQSFSIGSMLHASHRWGLTLDASYSAVSLGSEQLQSGWSEYSASNLLVTFGGKFYPWVHEFCSVAIGAHIGFNQYNSKVVGESGEGSWGGPEPVVGGVLEFSYFPIHALEVSVNVRADQLLGGENDAELEWKGTGAPSSSRFSLGVAAQIGFHF